MCVCCKSNYSDQDDDDAKDYDDDDDDDGYYYDLYIIGAVCLSVCLSVTKMLTFRIQGIWSFLMFIDTFPFSKVSGNQRNDQIP